ncbi:MAG: serine/threonine-protein kinase [Planctomycetaceae bacterium]
MAQLKTKDALKRYLITSQLVRLDDWNRVESQSTNGDGVPEIIERLETQHLLTSLQARRIQKGETEGLVLGRYKLLYRNASGSFARVYRASSLDGRETVALKLLRERWAKDPEAVAGFEREARICQRFRHPNIVPILDVGNEGDFHYFTMEFVEGGNLRDFLKIRQSVTPAEATQCMYEICAGLEYALELGATHRDLKLTNVLMSSRGVAKLVDFGLAGANGPTNAGTSDDVHRALEYASLERGTNAPNNDPRSDIFFAGAIFYEVLSGESPWPRTRDREERKQLSRYTMIRPLDTYRSDLPSDLLAIIAQMMDVNPNNRYQTAGEAKAALKHALKQMGAWKGDTAEIMSLAPGEPRTFRLLVVDKVKKRCKALKDYFAKHDFDTTFVRSPEVAVERLKGNDPPDGILFLADFDKEPVLSCFPQAQAYGRSKKTPCLAVFAAEDQDEVQRTLISTRWGTTLFQPVTLRDIRSHFDEIGAITKPS